MSHSHEPDDHSAIDVYFALNEVTLLLEYSGEIDLRAWLDHALMNEFHDFRERLVLPESDKRIAASFEMAQYDSPDGLNIPRSGSILYLQLARNSPLPEDVDPADEGFVRHYADLDVVDVVNGLNSVIGSEGLTTSFKEQSMRIRAAAPNWLFGGAPHQIIDGGPGGAPVKNAPGVAPLKYTMSILRANQGNAEAALECEPPLVDVVILDTAPPEDAYHRAVTTLTSNTLLQSVYPKLEIKYAPDLGGIPLPLASDQSDAYVSHHGNYKISDHGLFIAGIIHSIAPNARLHLFEILNANGTGTVATLMQGINAINVLLPTDASRVIINCSLCISFQNSLTLAQVFNWQFPSFAASFEAYLADMLLLPLKTVIQLALHHSPTSEIAIVAAAGNDGDGSPNPPAARLPAALPRVIGVGAMDDQGNLAPYSNLADQPPSDGLLTFGGMTQPSAVGQEKVTNNQTGILGLYIGDFPDGSPSTDGWARWSGTSFATAVVSGALAQGALSCSHIDDRPGNYLDVLKSRLPTNAANQTLLRAFQV